MRFPRNGNPTKYATCKRRERGTMNKTEAAYSSHLDLLLAAGTILWWAFEAMTLQIGDNCRYTSDFVVVAADGTLEIHDVKGRKGDGFWAEEDAIIKIKSVAQQFPFPVFIVWPKKGGGWDRKHIMPGPIIHSAPPTIVTINEIL